MLERLGDAHIRLRSGEAIHTHAAAHLPFRIA